MLEIYVDEISERLTYVFDYVFANNDCPFHITNDLLYFNSVEHSKLNYSELQIDGVNQIFPSTLLFEESIIFHQIEISEFNNEPCLKFDGVTDPFASIFYTLSRMEEYGDILHDEHERYPAKNSINFKSNWLETLVVERWSKAILSYLFDKRLISTSYKKEEVSIVPSFDIDNAYAYKLKEGSRKLFAVIKDYTKQNKERLQERKQVENGEIKDPYDTYEYIESIRARGFEVHLFWLLGDFSTFDRNISHNDPRHKRLIRNMAINNIVGIHPSYKSHGVEGQMRKEIGRLSEILDRTVKHSRQHFLKFRLPGTYHRLIKNGIEKDFSMGYASEVGFRAGTNRPFHWFDLAKNCKTNLIIHPFAYMDGTLNEYKGFSPEEAKLKIATLYREVKEFGGPFMFLWHNETIGEYGKWKGWRDVLEFTLNLNDNSNE